MTDAPKSFLEELEPVPLVRPPMPDMLRPWVEDAKARLAKRRASPGVKVYASMGRHLFVSPHDDDEAWEAMICAAFATRSHSTINAFLDQLGQISPMVYDPKAGCWKPHPDALNAALNIAQATKPRNELEACFAIQMVATHLLTMKLFAETVGGHRAVPDLRYSPVALKAARTFAQQMETFARMRGRTGKQVIKVKVERHEHKHVHQHVHDGRGDDNFRDQPREPRRLRADRKPTGEHEGGSALPGPDAAGVVVPMPRNERPEEVSHPRRREGLRRTQGEG
jgi:hypothetical protein